MIKPTYTFKSDYHCSLALTDTKSVSQFCLKNKCFIIIDKTVFELYPDLLTGIDPSRILYSEAGEKHKNLTTVAKFYRFFSKSNITRNSTICVFGGGTITDTAAYAVSTYKRGCRLVLIPTTLVGMIDASLGGKTAVNYANAKNQIGTFYPGDKIFLVPGFLNTLPETEFRNGLAEMLKLWFINPQLPDFIPINQSGIAPRLLFQFADAKLKICQKDLFDRKERLLLNLGHTFGHILESVSKYQMSHGQAVATGMSIAALMSNLLGYITDKTEQAIYLKINALGFDNSLDDNLKKLFLRKFLSLVRHDKKASDKNIKMILFGGWREVFIDEGKDAELVLSLLKMFL